MAPTILDDRSDESEIRRSRNRIVKQHRHSSVINYGESFEWKLSTRNSQNKVHWHVNWVRVLFVCNLLDSFHSLFERTRFATCDKCHSLTQRALIDKTELKQNGKKACIECTSGDGLVLLLLLTAPGTDNRFMYFFSLLFDVHKKYVLAKA